MEGPQRHQHGRGPSPLLLALASLFLLCRAALAMPGAYTDPAAFGAAAPGPLTAVDFESVTPGPPVSSSTLVPPGTTTGITLPGPVADVLDAGGPALALVVVEDATNNPALSGVRSLGIEDAGNFDAATAGTTLAFTFTQPVEAFGLTLITPEEPGQALFDADATLAVPGEATAALALSAGQPLGTFGGRAYSAYFLGVVGGGPFSSATLAFGGSTPDSGFFFNVDDLVIPVPEAGRLASLAAGGACVLALARRRKLSRRT